MLSFQILGPLEVVRDGRPLQLGAAKQRALVAILLLNEGEVVSTGRLIDGLWGEEPPATVDHLLHVYISRLRKLLEADEHELLLTRPPGYVLRLREGDELDAEVFETSVRQARSSGAPPSERPDACSPRSSGSIPARRSGRSRRTSCVTPRSSKHRRAPSWSPSNLACRPSQALA